MSRLAQLNAFLIVVIAGSILLVLSGGRDLSKTNVEYMPDMAYSISYQAFQVNPVLGSGQTLQAPPEGTVARGKMPLGFGPGPKDALRAGTELQSPVDLQDPELRRRGAKEFAKFCQPCHGPTGAGDGLVAQRGFPPPPSLTAAHAAMLPEGQIFHIISFGQGNMPAHAGQIAPGDRWCLVAHVRELQEKSIAARTEPGDAPGNEVGP